MVDAGPRVLLVVLAVLLTGLGGFLAAAEAAVSRVSRSRVAELVAEGRPASRSLALVVADSAPYLSVATFLRVISESGAAVMITIVCAGWLHSWWSVLLVAGGVMTVAVVRAGRGEPADRGPPARGVRRRWSPRRCSSGCPGCSGPLAHLLVALGQRGHARAAASGTARSPRSPSCATWSTWPARTRSSRPASGR